MQLAKEALDNDISSSNTICQKPGMMYQTNGLHFRSYMYMLSKLSFGFFITKGSSDECSSDL